MKGLCINCHQLDEICPRCGRCNGPKCGCICPEYKRNELAEKLAKIKEIVDKRTVLGSEAMASLSEIRELTKDIAREK